MFLLLNMVRGEPTERRTLILYEKKSENSVYKMNLITCTYIQDKVRQTERKTEWK